MNQRFFDKYKVELSDVDAICHIIKTAKKLKKLAKKGVDYVDKLEELDVMVDDFKEAVA